MKFFHFPTACALLMAVGGALLGIFLAFALPLALWLAWTPSRPSFELVCAWALGIYGLGGGLMVGLAMAHRMQKLVIKPPPPPKKEGS